METSDQKKKILIIEDEVLMLEALSKRFRDEGFTVLQARDGSVALNTALHQHPDLILLDILLPVMDGLTMFRKLRTEDSEYGEKVPVILLTNLSADNEKINQAITENNPAYYLVKTDWSINDVVQKVKDRLGIN